MALKALLLRGKIEAEKAKLEGLREKKTELETREAELEAAIGEMTDETTDEDREAVEAEVEKLETDKTENEESVSAVEAEVERLEAELAQTEERQKATGGEKDQKRGGIAVSMSEQRAMRRFAEMNMEERMAMAGREDVKEFLERVRDFKGQTRAITGADLTIPVVMLDLIRENIMDYSKLMKHIRLRPVAGTARQVVSGTVPEAVWTEACGVLNELSWLFNRVEMDAYKVGGYIPICNANLEDSDLNLMSEIMIMLGQAIGLAVDKAILYGTGTKMPMGILTRLAQATKPTDYPADARTWENLSTTNIISIAAASSTGIKLFQEIIKASGNAKSKYSRGTKFWTMNDKTYTTLVAEGLAVNSAGALVAGVGGTMPAIGGVIEVLDFIPDNTIIGGYGDVYLLVERAGMQLAQSEHVRFIEDETVFKGTARYDGEPVIAEAFVAIGLNAVKPSATAVTFAADEANTPPAGE